MPLIENEFEQALMNQLPPHARDVAQDLMGTYSLGELLMALQANEPDQQRLAQKKVPARYWEAILRATLLAKCTYFIPNPKLSREERLFLVRVACMSAGYPLSSYRLFEILEITHQEMPVFHQWLQRLTADGLEQDPWLDTDDKTSEPQSSSN